MGVEKSKIDRLFAPTDWLGQALMRHAYLLIEVFELAVLAVWTTWSNRDRGFHRPYAADSIGKEILRQIYDNGCMALPIIFALGLVTGSAAILQAVNQFNMVGGQEIIGQFLVLTIAREIAPLLTALVVIARSATAVTTKLGNMRANGEIEALKVMGVHPYSYVVYPRLVGGIVSVGGLSAFFLLFAFMGGYVLTSVYHEMDPRFYYSLIMQALGEPEGWLLFFVKVVGNAIMIFSIACLYGLRVQRSHHEVPVAAANAVMRCLSYIVTFNIGASVIFYVLLFAVRGSI